MATPTPAPLLAFVAASAGALIGLVAGTLLVGGRTPTPPTEAPAVDLTPLLEELRALRQDLRTEATRGTAIERPDRRDAEPALDGQDQARLAGTVTELVRVVEALTVRADALGTQQMASRGVLRQVASGSSRDVPALTAIRKGFQDDEKAMQAEWMFVPATEVLRRFGRPTSIFMGELGLRWEYEVEAEDDNWDLSFTIVDGVVVRIDD